MLNITYKVNGVSCQLSELNASNIVVNHLQNYTMSENLKESDLLLRRTTGKPCPSKNIYRSSFLQSHPGWKATCVKKVIVSSLRTNNVFFLKIIIILIVLPYTHDGNVHEGRVTGALSIPQLRTSKLNTMSCENPHILQLHGLRNKVAWVPARKHVASSPVTWISNEKKATNEKKKKWN